MERQWEARFHGHGLMSTDGRNGQQIGSFKLEAYYVTFCKGAKALSTEFAPTLSSMF